MTEPNLNCSGELTKNSSDPQRIDAYLPTNCVQNHAANLLQLPDRKSVV